MDTRSPARKENSQRTKAEVLRLKRQNKTFTEIGKILGFSRQRAQQIHKQALEEIPFSEVDTYRREQLALLDSLLDEVTAVLDRTHLTVSHGQVVRHMGQPLEDDGPTLAAVDRAVKIHEKISDLLGLKIPVKQEIGADVQVRYEVVGVDLEALT